MIPTGADVVVFGGGLAGHCAALAAAEGGASVLLLEKTGTVGGSSVQAGGGFAFSGTGLQAEQGVADDADRLRRDLLETGGHRNDPALVDVYVERQLETYEWLRGKGVEFKLPPPSTPGTINRVHGTQQGAAVAVLHRRVLDHPRISYAGHAAARRLIGGAGGVRGARLEVEGRALDVEAARAVVLATGGFSRNRKLLQAYAPELADSVMMGGEGNTGDGLLMANAIGAGQTDMGYITSTFGVAVSRYPELDQGRDEDLVLLFAIYRGAIMVNRVGVRFADESANYKALSAICARQPDAVAFQIFDSKVMAQSSATSALNNYKDAYDRGLIRSADSPEGLAQSIGVDAATLRSTITRYNSDADAGRDREFGRKSAAYGGAGALTRIDAPPYFAFPCTNAVTTTYCGLTVNADMQVLDVFGEVIPGLFAAGEIVGGFHGRAYLSGSALAKAAITGRVAGGNAAGATSAAPR
jgi:flavocytochrome c